MAAGRRARRRGVDPQAARSKQNFRIGGLAAELLGPSFAADTGEWGTYTWSQFLAGAPAMRIAGGTDEIQHNILGDRVLGLPR